MEAISYNDILKKHFDNGHNSHITNQKLLTCELVQVVAL